MILVSSLLSLLLAACDVQALVGIPPPTVTVSTSTRIISATPTARPTPTPSRSVTTACVGGSTSCLPSSTQLVYYACNELCLASSTKTYFTTTVLPPVTVTIPCRSTPTPIPYVKKSALEGGEVDLEKRWTCAPGPTLTPSVTLLPCTACTVYPRSTTITNTLATTKFVSYRCLSTTTSLRPTKTLTTVRDPCWWTCYDANNVYTTLPYTPGATPTPTGSVQCALACI